MPLRSPKKDMEFRSHYEKLPLPFQSLDIEGKILEVNQHWLELLGYSREEVVGSVFSQYIHPAEASKFSAQFALLLSIGSVSNVEFHLQHKEGDSVYVVLDGVVQKGANEGFRRTFCILRNVTEHKQLENIRRQAEDVWTRTFDAITDIITIQNKDLSIIRANKAAYSFFQAQEGELKGRRCYEVFTGESTPCSHCPILVTLQDGNSHTEIITHERLNKVFRVNSSYISSEDGQNDYLVHVATDITESVKAEKILRESEERFAKAFQASPGAMVISEIQSGRFIDFNQSWLDILGYFREELIGKTSKQIGIWVDPSTRGLLIEELSYNAFFKDRPVNFITKSGEVRSALWSAEVITIDGKDLMLSMISDITEREKALEALKRSEEKFALAFDASPDAININRLDDGMYIDVNSGFVELTGYSRHEVEGRTSLEINIWHDPCDRNRLVKSLHAKGYCENLEAKFRKKDGSLATALMSARIIMLHDEPHILSLTRDISKLKEAEQKIAEQKLLFESMFNAIDDAVVITDTSRNVILVNRGMKTSFGYDPEDLIGKTIRDFYSDTNAFRVFGENVLNNTFDRSDQRYIATYRHKSGRLRFGETFRVKLYDQDNRWIGNLSIIRDITEQQRAQAERERLVAAIEQTSDAIVITDSQGNIQYVNPAFEKVTGYSSYEIKGQNPRILKSGEQDEFFYQTLWQTIANGETFHGRMVNRRKNGELLTEEVTISPVFDANGNVVNYVAVKRDITRQLLLEEHFYHTQKMEAIGTLAGGIAHDFNNILSAIIGYTSIAKSKVERNDPVQEDLDQVLAGGGRAADLVKQILTFARQESQEQFRPLKMQYIIKEVLKLIRSSLPTTIELSQSIDNTCGSIMADPGQMHQVLMNLCTNAKQAIGVNHGEMHIRLAQLQPAELTVLAGQLENQSTPYIHLAVRDSGCGMDAQTLERIFDPFFTTREKEQGTGLGLAVVHGIVKKHQGVLTVESEVGKGTVFNIFFPVIEQEDDTVTAVCSREYRGNERIMIIDDDEAVGSVTQLILGKLGYRVTLFSDSLEAVKHFRENPQSCDLVLTDMTMPKMTGVELAREMMAIRPELPVILMSGYSEAIDKEKAIRIGIRDFLLKPVSKAELSVRIKEVLDSGAHSHS